MADTHGFNVKLATLLGFQQAILLQHLWYWHQANCNKENSIIDGKVWTYNTYERYHEIFPYLTKRQIALGFEKLEEKGLIVTGNYNKMKFDKTKWYALTDKGIKIFDSNSNVNSKKHNVTPVVHNVTPMVHNVTPEEHNVTAIPDINTDNKTDNKPYTISDEWKQFNVWVEDNMIKKWLRTQRPNLVWNTIKQFQQERKDWSNEEINGLQQKIQTHLSWYLPSIDDVKYICNISTYFETEKWNEKQKHGNHITNKNTPGNNPAWNKIKQNLL
jgi:hypothetical protein